MNTNRTSGLSLMNMGSKIDISYICFCKQPATSYTQAYVSEKVLRKTYEISKQPFTYGTIYKQRMLSVHYVKHTIFTASFIALTTMESHHTFTITYEQT